MFILTTLVKSLSRTIFNALNLSLSESVSFILLASVYQIINELVSSVCAFVIFVSFIYLLWFLKCGIRAIKLIRDKMCVKFY